MKIIIVGCGKVGSSLAEQLNQEEHEITVIDNNQKVVEQVSINCDVMGVIGDGVSYSVQMEAGVKDADLLIAVTDSDEKNLLTCLMAKKAGGCKTIARVRNPVYHREIHYLREELGLSMIINPEKAAAQEMAKLIRFPSAIKVDTFARQRIELLQVKIPMGSKLHQCAIMDIPKRIGVDILICAVERKEEIVIPTGSFILQEDDRISIMGSYRQVNDFFRKIGIEIPKVKKAMLIGGSRLAYYLAEMLLESGIQVRILEKEKQRCEELSELLPKAFIIEADGTDKEVLEEEGIGQMDFFASLTNLDEENIMLGLYANRYSHAKVVTKVNHLRFEDVIEDLNLGSVVYPKYITANSILQYVRARQNSYGSNVETLYRIINNKAEALAFRIHANCSIIEKTFEELELKENLLVCCIIRDTAVIMPRGQDVMKVGDVVIVVTTHTKLQDIEDILKER
ncbi:MAG: Trk system potassium transporter TrkA [Firmicutes bacterium]|uniref:Trk system potassium uptake protein TrkA n=1 Tax=Candidatus Scybalomonas excrementavium TaxID=2840943 RepID=A0A9D9I0M7_9FIRM|nr:Trk system potassium transporter TrkA [Candidatus Scybalomonas excrementavium]